MLKVEISGKGEEIVVEKIKCIHVNSFDKAAKLHKRGKYRKL